MQGANFRRELFTAPAEPTRDGFSVVFRSLNKRFDVPHPKGFEGFARPDDQLHSMERVVIKSVNAFANFDTATGALMGDQNLTTTGKIPKQKEIVKAAVQELARVRHETDAFKLSLAAITEQHYRLPPSETTDMLTYLHDREYRDYARSLDEKGQRALAHSMLEAGDKRLIFALLRSPTSLGLDKFEDPMGDLRAYARTGWCAVRDIESPEGKHHIVAGNELLEWASPWPKVIGGTIKRETLKLMDATTFAALVPPEVTEYFG